MELRTHHTECPRLGKGESEDVLIEEIAIDFGQFGIDVPDVRIWAVIYRKRRPDYDIVSICPYCDKDLDTVEFEFWTA